MTDRLATVFFLPGLGFSAKAAAPLRDALGDRFRVVGIDLPGQGGAPDAPDGAVGSMVDAAIRTIEKESDGGPFLLAAHSMGGKVAALVAARVLSGQANIFGLSGAVLMAPSPPTPEPMDDEKRSEMLGWVAGGPISDAHAREFISQNVAAPLDDDFENAALRQVRESSPLGWSRWLTECSREDVSAAVGVIDLPVIVVAGEDDDDLGASAQPNLLAPVYPRARFVSLSASGHLLPYERAPEVAAEIVRLWQSTVDASPVVPEEWGRLIASSRTGTKERGALSQRAISDDPEYSPGALTTGQLEILRALADRLVPQSDSRRIDLAARVDADLATGRGDGWRPSDLPDDAAAYRLGLDGITAVWPADAEQRDDLIRRIIAGEPIGSSVDTNLLKSWLEDARNDLTRVWLAHPASLARVGYDGFGTSGAAEDPAGYAELGAGARDPWEAAELGAARAGGTVTGA